MSIQNHDKHQYTYYWRPFVFAVDINLDNLVVIERLRHIRRRFT